jgi:hypothetical protein
MPLKKNISTEWLTGFDGTGGTAKKALRSLLKKHNIVNLNIFLAIDATRHYYSLDQGLRPGWPPARRAYAPERILEYQEDGIMGLNVFCRFFLKQTFPALKPDVPLFQHSTIPDGRKKKIFSVKELKISIR